MTVDSTAPGNRIALDRLLGVPEMAWLVGRVRSRIIAARGASLTGVVQCTHPTEAQRAAGARLVGRPKRPGSTLRVDLADVEKILRRGPWPPGLADAIETLTGPVVDHVAERERMTTAWAEAEAGLRGAAVRFTGVGAWWAPWCAAGGLKRAARVEAARTSADHGPSVAAGLVDQAAAVLEALPSAGSRWRCWHGESPETPTPSMLPVRSGG